ncbi:MAG: hypothetical protein J6M92_13705 [Oribacterium sp.]|nr:hypothetical protein [Oribacterium sp.]
MKRRNLCRTKKLLAVIIAASMCMNSGMIAMAGQEVSLGSVVVDNNVTVTAMDKDNSEKVEENVTSHDSAPAVTASSSGGHSAEVTVTGDVEATNSSYGTATGVAADSFGKTESPSSDKNSSTSVTVEGEVSASAERGTATGISATSTSGGSTDVSVGGKVSASAEEGGTATGISATSSSGGSTYVTAEKSVSITAKESDYASGVNVYANGTGSTSNVTVGKDVSVTTSGSYATGIRAKASSGANIDVEVGDDLTVSSAKGSTGIDATARGEKSSVSVSVDGDVSATKTSDNSGPDDSSVISTYTSTASSSVNINVGGNVTGNGGITASGSGQTNITVGKSVVQESQKSETQLTESESSSGGIAITLSDGELAETADVTVKVAENVTADTTAVNITKNSEESHIRLEVDGTISGGKHNIVLSEKSSLKNLDITVWRVDTSDGKNVVETFTPVSEEQSKEYSSAMLEWEQDNTKPKPEEPKPTYTANLEAEKMINYIIQVADVQTPGGNLGIAGASAGGVYTAHQNDTVYLEVTIPDGYTIDGFYNVDGAADVTVISGDGKYYLNVPRGGGVYVGVKMKKIESTATLDPTPSSSSSTSTSTSYSTYGSGDHRKSESNDQNWTVGNNPNDNSGNRTTLPPEFTGLQIHAMTMGGDTVQNLSDVLTFIDPLAALNNFMDKGIPTQGTQNVIGAGIVNFNNLFMASLTDTVDVPVSASVKANQSYTVLFSDGTSIVVPCIMDGLLTIPFNKNTAGLTYMIYGTDLNPGAFVGLTTSN